MSTPIDRAQLRKETDRLNRSSNVSEGEALHAVLRRKGEGDFVLATGDEDVKSAVNQTKTAVENMGEKVPHGLIPGAFHKVVMDTSGQTEDVYTYHMDDDSTMVVTISYTDNSKSEITQVERA